MREPTANVFHPCMVIFGVTGGKKSARAPVCKNPAFRRCQRGGGGGTKRGGQRPPISLLVEGRAFSRQKLSRIDQLIEGGGPFKTCWARWFRANSGFHWKVPTLDGHKKE